MAKLWLFLLLLMVVAHENSPIELHIVPHSHCDAGWLWEYDQYRAVSHGIISSIIAALTANPARTAAWGDVSFLALWWERVDQSERDKLLTLIKEQRLDVVGGGWVQHDEAVISYRDAHAQLRVGLSWLHTHLNTTAQVLWQIDSFGHSPTLLDLAASLNFTSAILNRIPYRLKSTLRRQQQLELLVSTHTPSTDPIFVHILPTHYSAPAELSRILWRNASPDIHSVEQACEAILHDVQQRTQWQRHSHMLYLVGDDIRFRDAIAFDILDKVLDCVRASDSNVRVRYSTVSQYSAAVQKERIEFPLVSSASLPLLLPYSDNRGAIWSGFFSTSPTLKASSRRMTSLLSSVKLMTAAVALQKGVVPTQSPYSDCERWGAVLQHHDAITGTARRIARVDYQERALSCEKSLHKLGLNLTVSILATSGLTFTTSHTASPVRTISITNPSTNVWAGVIRLRLPAHPWCGATWRGSGSGEGAGLRVTGADGGAIEAQITTGQRHGLQPDPSHLTLLHALDRDHVFGNCDKGRVRGVDSECADMATLPELWIHTRATPAAVRLITLECVSGGPASRAVPASEWVYDSKGSATTGPGMGISVSAEVGKSTVRLLDALTQLELHQEYSVNRFVSGGAYIAHLMPQPRAVWYVAVGVLCGLLAAAISLRSNQRGLLIDEDDSKKEKALRLARPRIRPRARVLLALLGAGCGACMLFTTPDLFAALMPWFPLGFVLSYALLVTAAHGLWYVAGVVEYLTRSMGVVCALAALTLAWAPDVVDSVWWQPPLPVLAYGMAQGPVADLLWVQRAAVGDLFIVCKLGDCAPAGRVQQEQRVEPLDSNTCLLSQWILPKSAPARIDQNGMSLSALPDATSPSLHWTGQFPHLREAQMRPATSVISLPRAPAQFVIALQRSVGVYQTSHGVKVLEHRRLIQDDWRGLSQPHDDATSFQDSRYISVEEDTTQAALMRGLGAEQATVWVAVGSLAKTASSPHISTLLLPSTPDWVRLQDIEVEQYNSTCLQARFGIRTLPTPGVSEQFAVESLLKFSGLRMVAAGEHPIDITGRLQLNHMSPDGVNSFPVILCI